MERDILINVARTSLRTKVPKELADHLTEVYIYLYEHYSSIKNSNYFVFWFKNSKTYIIHVKLLF